jgi:hypothetical protein
MPAQDKYHDVVVKALTDEGWTITDDPLRLSYGTKNLWVDVGAERETLAAEKGGERIAVEIKSFVRHSEVEDLENAIGQLNLYRDVLDEIEPDRKLFLAIPWRAYDGIFSEKIGRLVLKKQRINLIVFDELQERITEWIPQPH